MPLSTLVIVGAGHAGGTLAALLRQQGFEGRLVLIGDEPVAPYQRPPLSKAYLKGDSDAEAVKLRPDAFYGEAGVELRTGVRVTAIARDGPAVTLDTGERIACDALVLATGSIARKLPVPGAHFDNVHELRTLADADRLKSALQPGGRLVVVGGGYVGLETAASARALGCEVTLIERESRCLARVACEPLAAFFESYHRARGVEILTGAGVTHFDGDDKGRVAAAHLNDGRVLDCEAVLVGVGGAARDDLARAAGLDCQNGVVVDLEARTSDPRIWAIGDVTSRPMPLYEDRRFRLESVPNALEQAKQAAASILGRPAPAGEVPWFWSDQYDLKLQIAGVPFDTDEILIRGDVSAAKFAVFHLKAGRIRAVEAVNAPPEFMAGRQLIGSGRAIDRVKLADPAVSMKDVAA
jgi:3-phenylpropionate/trans-cinnamate dioxygenase ferredoxin reductase subunit